MSKSTLIDLSIIITRETRNAYLVRESFSKEGEWVPKSLVELSSEKIVKGYRHATATMPEWLAQEKGLI